MGMNTQLTIIIPSKNEGRDIIEVLKLLMQTNTDCKIIVADSSDDEGSLLLLKKYQTQYRKNLKVISGGLPAIARNKGASLVTTPYVLFLDADIYIKDSSLINYATRVIIGGEYDLVTVKLKTLEGRYDWVYRVFDIFQWISSKTKPFAVGGFMLFKTETFRNLGGFNEADRIAEDYHLSSKIAAAKFKILNRYAYTPARRFDKKGFWYMAVLAWRSWLNRNNDEFFKNDYNYWT
jgi:glycosyltransferase involved in cell wall biosynthesis